MLAAIVKILVKRNRVPLLPEFDGSLGEYHMKKKNSRVKLREHLEPLVAAFRGQTGTTSSARVVTATELSGVGKTSLGRPPAGRSAAEQRDERDVGRLG
jgi:hypothetical protein